MLSKAAINVLKNCMGVKKKDNILIITDSKLYDIGKVFLNYGNKFGNKADLIQIPIKKIHGAEPPMKVAKAMLNYDIILGITSRSLSHTKARKNASKKGIRIATMPGMTKDIVKRTLTADFKKIEEKNKRLIQKLKFGSKVRVKTDLGTDFEVEINNKRWYDDSGVYSGKKRFGNLPAGEIGFMPTEGKSNGTYFVDASFGGIGFVDKPVKIKVKDGYAVKITGGKSAKILNRFLLNKKYRNIAEFSFGTNPRAKISGTTLEDEKVKGTIHIALGNNMSYGGKVDVPFHVDGIIKKPDVFLDNRQIMKKGKFLV